VVFYPSRPNDPPTAQPARGIQLKIRVLLVDDNKDIRELIRFLLEWSGVTVVEAEDGRQAVQMAVSNSPDMILMDLAMPDMDGFDAVRAIRKHSELSSVPIIAISAYGHEYYADAKAAGCDDVIQKPIDVAAIKPLLDIWVTRPDPSTGPLN
jgi:CheY-like chemotaxis protein